MNNPYTNPFKIPTPLDIKTATAAEIAQTTRWARTFLLVLVIAVFGGFWLPALLLLGKLTAIGPYLAICTVLALGGGELMVRHAKAKFSANQKDRA